MRSKATSEAQGEGERKHRPAKPGDLLNYAYQRRRDGRQEGKDMTTQTVAVQSSSRLFAVLGAALLGITMIVLAGHVQASALHDAAHDVRHATGFPCH